MLCKVWGIKEKKLQETHLSWNTAQVWNNSLWDCKKDIPHSRIYTFHPHPITSTTTSTTSPPPFFFLCDLEGACFTSVKLQRSSRQQHRANKSLWGERERERERKREGEGERRKRGGCAEQERIRQWGRVDSVSRGWGCRGRAHEIVTEAEVLSAAQ